jgi:hypothetical protein
MSKKIDTDRTYDAIVERCNSSVGFSIDMVKMRGYRNDVKALKEFAKFVGIPVLYETANT